MKKEAKRMEEKPKKEKNTNMSLAKVFNILKAIILVVMIIASYMLSDRIVDYLMTVDLIIIKRAVNIILITVIMAIYFKK